MGNKSIEAHFNNDKCLVIGKSLLEVADWKTGEKISVAYCEKSDAIILKNETNIYDLQESGAIELFDDLIEELTLPQGTEFSAVYDETTDTITLKPLTLDAS